MASLTPSPFMQFMDANGEPLVAGKLYTYASGTTTPLATYIDATGTVANTNPVILDTTGSAAIWCGASLYTFVLKTALDTLVWTSDGLNAPQASTLAALAAAGGAALIGTAQGTTVQTQLSRLSGVDGAAYVTYKQDSLFSVSTDVSAKLNEWVSVKDFGDNTTPGTTDMTSVFNTAFATTTGGLCVVPGIEAYKLTTAPTNINTGILTLGGTYVTNNPPGTADVSVFGKSPFILQQYQDKAASATPLSGNEFTMVVMSTTPANTSSSGSYQKGPLYLRMIHNEPSTYGPFVGHDAVGIESQVILNTTTNGRAWSHHGLVQVNPSCDGYAVGYEIEIINDGSTQGDPQDEQTSKNGIQIVCRKGIATKAIGVIGQPGGGAAGSWAHGIVFYPESINVGGAAMIIPSMVPISVWNAGAYPTTWFTAFYGDASDNLVIGTGATAISLNAPVNCIQGLNTTRAYITAAAGAGSTTELVLGNTVAATAGAAAGYLNIYIGATAYKIPYHAV